MSAENGEMTLPDKLRNHLKVSNFGFSTLTSKTNFTYIITRVVSAANATQEQVANALDNFANKAIEVLDASGISTFNLLDKHSTSNENGNTTFSIRVRAASYATSVRPKKAKLVPVTPVFDLDGNITNEDEYNEYIQKLAAKKSANPAKKLSGNEISSNGTPAKAKKNGKVASVPVVNQLELPDVVLAEPVF